jgi:ubiquinone/menaquinone biosynthesis C-methylase UbiE
VASLTDRDVLVGLAYADPGPLEARKAIYRWQEPAVDLPALAISRLRDVTGLVVDIGCGSGQYLRRIAADRPDLCVLGLDLSPGMRPHAIGDAQQLPLADGVAGAVLAMHMLYHVPDIDRAVGELARVLSRNGIAIVATNGQGHMRQFRDLFAEAVHAAGPAVMIGQPAAGPAVGHRFRLENGPAMLRNHFASAEAMPWQAQIRIPDAAAVLAYLDSTRAGREDSLPNGVGWDAMLDAAHAIIDRAIARDGAFTASSHTGVIICRGPRTRS